MTIEASYIWLKVKNESFSVYCHKTKINDELWGKLFLGFKVRFTLGFNYYGLAVNEMYI